MAVCGKHKCGLTSIVLSSLEANGQSGSALFIGRRSGCHGRRHNTWHVDFGDSVFYEARSIYCVERRWFMSALKHYSVFMRRCNMAALITGAAAVLTTAEVRL